MNFHNKAQLRQPIASKTKYTLRLKYVSKGFVIPNSCSPYQGNAIASQKGKPLMKFTLNNL